MPCPICGYAGDNVFIKIDEEGYRWVVRCFECDEWFDQIPYEDFRPSTPTTKD